LTNIPIWGIISISTGDILRSYKEDLCPSVHAVSRAVPAGRTANAAASRARNAPAVKTAHAKILKERGGAFALPRKKRIK